jgi:nucleotide-binding universal stress UspA family protein
MITQSYRIVADLPGRALVHVVQTVNAQLLVLAARQGIARVLGTVSQYVLRNAPCPVLTVPEADIDSRGLEAAQHHSTSPTA